MKDIYTFTWKCTVCPFPKLNRKSSVGGRGTCLSWTYCVVISPKSKQFYTEGIVAKVRKPRKVLKLELRKFMYF